MRRTGSRAGCLHDGGAGLPENEAAAAGSRRYRKPQMIGAVLERYGADRTPSYHVTLVDGAN
jgi:hypothetical protein